MSCTYWTEKDGGYEKVHGNRQLETGDWVNTGKLPVHRLCAVAWFGWDAVKNRHIHHRLPIPWLNVESNLLPLPAPEHANLGAKFRRDGLTDAVINDVLDGLGGGLDG